MARDLGAIHWADRLSDSTRQERRILLAVSTLGLVIIRGGVIPTRIEFLGVDLSTDNQVFLFRTLAAVIGYFLVAFVMYAVVDNAAWTARLRHEYSDSISPDMKAAWRRLVDETPILVHGDTPIKQLTTDQITAALTDAVMKTHTSGNRWSYAGGWLRFAFDFVIPVALGGYAIYLLLTATPVVARLPSYPIWVSPFNR
jgi:hypothetical protein